MPVNEGVDQKDGHLLNDTKPKLEKQKKASLIVATRKDSEKSLQAEAVDNKHRPSISESKESKESEGKDTVPPISSSPKVPRKFINNWRQACDRTKDRTKELLKKWRTLPESGGHMMEPQETSVTSGSDDAVVATSGWSEHVWTTWVKRFPSGEEPAEQIIINLTEIQRKKFAHFFVTLLDLDRDDVISLTDFEALSERLRHFADWSKNSAEYNRLREVQRDFIETFLLPATAETPIHSYEILEKKLSKEQLSLDQWLFKWSQILEDAHNFLKLPLWLQYFPRILFQVINKSGTGIITRNELSSFYSSVLGLTTKQVDSCINDVYRVLTSNGDHTLSYPVFRLCFANFILARFPNGPGQYLLGPVSGTKYDCFPIEYKALNCAPEELEKYSPELTTNRRSVIV